MLEKYERIPVWIIALGCLVSLAFTTTAAGKYRGAEITRAGQMGSFQSQGATVSSNIFGLTVADIYDLGVIVTDVELGSSAAWVGIRNDDVILAVNGVPVLGTYEFQKFIAELVGGPISFTVIRFGQINTFIIDTRW